ncbi:hypothetical protein [Endozoicomonas sp. 4G]|uniref:hypothetical protein n=1 Tax=Endozoicomonas sp. 4G TaxID=2872754 RepID=UPI002078975E|nr:hypothetical protein [Endozoicomonas sp. 4G]
MSSLSVLKLHLKPFTVVNKAINIGHKTRLVAGYHKEPWKNVTALMVYLVIMHRIGYGLNASIA